MRAGVTNSQGTQKKNASQENLLRMARIQIPDHWNRQAQNHHVCQEVRDPADNTKCESAVAFCTLDAMVPECLHWNALEESRKEQTDIPAKHYYRRDVRCYAKGSGDSKNATVEQD